jgi:endonuclease/exonuclease/phosphatase family metal-dependent hydrolase
MTLSPTQNQARIEPLTEVLARPGELPDVETFRIAAYNVHNLFGPDPDVYSQRPSPPATDEQLDALGEMIRNLDADAIAFEEVQNEKVLANLFRTRVNPRIRDRAYRFSTFVCIPSRDPRGINVALATRLAVNGSLTFHDREFGALDERPTRFSRDLLGVDLFATPTYRFLFFVAHLKSKMGGAPSQTKREIEATEIRTIVDTPQFGAGQPYIQQDMVVCGDMNEDPGQEPIEILKGKNGGAPLRDVLEDGGPTYPTHTRYRKTRLDYMFASPSIRIEGATVHRDDVDTNVDIEVARTASDHFPVSATVRVR